MSLPRRALFGLAALALAGCAPTTPTAAPSSTPVSTPVPAARPAPPELPRQLPGVGPRLLAAVPAGTRQALVVTGDGPEADTGHAVLYRDDGNGWLAGPSWPARNARRGWTADHREGDLRSPVGVFGLGDAGGRLPNPGTRLPYDRNDAFTIDGTGFAGEPLAGSFDYVVAIDYNRVPGTSPLDTRRPRGGRYGGGIWLHVDHGGPTHGCVGLPVERMRELLLALDPALHPVVVMGDAQSLAG
ncbi:L,D-transpeptidase family protein [Kitasatospora sp. NPDC101183]|uniref:L,D-transpeptidase family protein n=1 Tax=Kitasatospora sp. NPDC101183 TaxID=3364100 RepID=UPI00381913CE